MDLIGRGIIAGFLATLALSAMVEPLNALAHNAALRPPAFAWVVHFFVGSFIWGGAFALLQPLARGPFWLRGLVFGILAWIVATALAMAATRAGVFGFNRGFATPAVLLVVHALYGTLLGTIFGLLGPREHDINDTPMRPSHR